MSKNRGTHFSHLNANSLLLKIEEIRHLVKLTNASVIVISEIKLDASVLSNEVVTEGYDLIRMHYFRKGGELAYTTKHSVAYSYSTYPELLLKNFVLFNYKQGCIYGLNSSKISKRSAKEVKLNSAIL